MTGEYNSWLVILSIVVAVTVSYTALHLAARVMQERGAASRAWLIGGAIAMGVGIWSMHFIGMLAFTLPIPLVYGWGRTLASLAIAIASSGFALAIVGREENTNTHLVVSAGVMGMGIGTMHYAGMNALQIVPMIRYEPLLVVASFVISIAASFVALWLAFRLRSGDSWKIHIARLSAAVVMGCAIAGMHYTGMAASRFSPDSYCIGNPTSSQYWLAITIAVAALSLLAITLILILYDAHLESRGRQHNLQLEKANEQLQHLTTHDPLTGLPNRLLLTDRLEQSSVRADRHGVGFAVMVLDLDRFKQVNDSLGHQAGDETLKEIARRLASVMRRTDTLARLGGDEFVLVLNELRSLSEAEMLADKVLQTVRRPLSISGVEVHVSPSIGIATYPEHAKDSTQLLVHADAAMYAAKRAGRNNYQIFAPTMSAFTRERLDLENGLRSAIAGNQLELHYQPKVDVATGRIGSAEALVRWRHPQRGLLSPGDFILLAEETGLILTLGNWVLRQACKQTRSWHHSGFTGLRVAVNLSAQQLKQKNLVREVQSALEDSKLEARFLELELTETTVMQDAEQSVRVLRELSDLGVRISVDDFGTGYSSLSYLRRLPLDKLKIDRSFIRGVATSTQDAAIVRAIVYLAHSLHLTVIAEGVETVDQLEFLRQAGCDQYQGFHCSGPMTPEAFTALLRERRAGKQQPPSSTPDPGDSVVLRNLRKLHKV